MLRRFTFLFLLFSCYQYHHSLSLKIQSQPWSPAKRWRPQLYHVTVGRNIWMEKSKFYNPSIPLCFAMIYVCHYFYLSELEIRPPLNFRTGPPILPGRHRRCTDGRLARTRIRTGHGIQLPTSGVCLLTVQGTGCCGHNANMARDYQMWVFWS